MLYLYIYVIGALLTTIGVGIQRGMEYNRGDFWDVYEFEDLAKPIGLGIIWPLLIPTAVPFLIGQRTIRYMEHRKKIRADRTLHEAREKKRQDKELAAYMPEVEKLLTDKAK